MTRQSFLVMSLNTFVTLRVDLQIKLVTHVQVQHHFHKIMQVMIAVSLTTAHSSIAVAVAALVMVAAYSSWSAFMSNCIP